MNPTLRTFKIGATALMLTAATAPSISIAAQAFVPNDVRIVGGISGADDTYQVAAAYRLRAPRPLRAHHLEVAVGVVSAADEQRPFFSVGPVWRFPIASGRHYVDLGFSPTILSGTQVGDRDLGGHLHFTSSVAYGLRFGPVDAYSVRLRVQHTSNGGLNGNNPGLDLVGFDFGIEF